MNHMSLRSSVDKLGGLLACWFVPFRVLLPVHPVPPNIKLKMVLDGPQGSCWSKKLRNAVFMGEFPRMCVIEGRTK
jgi:hypothetical protein